jgi:hypothetical protein
VGFWFDRWLDEQPIERKREIQKLERAWVRNHYARVAEDPNENAFRESLIGHREIPAGPLTIAR